jgi:hypothetical protein
MPYTALGALHRLVEFTEIVRAFAHESSDRLVHNEGSAALGRARQLVEFALDVVRQAN